MESMTAFLRRRVMGKTLYTGTLSYSLENGALEGVYSDQMSFTNLTTSPTGFQFDLFVVSREKLFHVNPDASRGALRKDFSCASHFRYHLAKRKSTGNVIGVMRYVSASADDIPAEAMASAVETLALDAEGTTLSWREKEIGYRDQPGAGETHRSVAFEAKCRFFLEGDLVAYEYDGVCFDVNPDDFTRTLSQAAIPKFVARERTPDTHD